MADKAPSNAYHHAGFAGAAIALACVVSACANSDGQSPALSLPKVADLTAALPQAPSPNETPSGSATELYSRIARGAVGCWFGAQGGMKKDYIYHAEADAPSRGGKAEVTIHVRDPSQPNPRGAKAYKILITPKNETSADVTTENLKLPEEQATTMTGDVNRWARGEQGCRNATTARGWSEDEAKAKAAVEDAHKVKGKTAKAAAKAKAAAASAAKP